MHILIRSRKASRPFFFFYRPSFKSKRRESRHGREFQICSNKKVELVDKTTVGNCASFELDGFESKSSDHMWSEKTKFFLNTNNLFFKIFVQKEEWMSSSTDQSYAWTPSNTWGMVLFDLDDDQETLKDGESFATRSTWLMKTFTM